MTSPCSPLLGRFWPMSSLIASINTWNATYYQRDRPQHHAQATAPRTWSLQLANYRRSVGSRTLDCTPPSWIWQKHFAMGGFGKAWPSSDAMQSLSWWFGSSMMTWISECRMTASTPSHFLSLQSKSGLRAGSNSILYGVLYHAERCLSWQGHWCQLLLLHWQWSVEPVELHAKMKVHEDIVSLWLFDNVLNASTQSDLQGNMEPLTKACDDFGLTISTKRTNVLHQPAPALKPTLPCMARD